MEEVLDLELQDPSKIRGAVPRLLYRVVHENGRRERFPSRICKVPDTLRDLSPNSFKPRVVSIGPLHRDVENLKAFEAKKACYVGKLIKCMSTSEGQEEKILKSCVDKVSPLMGKVQARYNWKKGESDHDDEFIEFMVMDACFILGFIIHISEYILIYGDKSYRGNMLPNHNIIYDLVLIGNQIPFFFLDQIFQCTVLEFMPNTSLVEFLLPFLNLLNLFNADITTNNVSINTTTDHILGLLYQCYKPPSRVTSDPLTSTIHSAVDLDRAGVYFKPNQKPKWLMGMDVKLHNFPCFSWYWGESTVTMPVLYVHDFTELVLRNLIAYEHHSRQSDKYITSYAHSMDMLVNAKEDVAKLVESRVLVNYMGSDQEAADMINSICREVAREHFFYTEEWNKLDNYCKGYWPKKIKWLRRTYFNKPWNSTALVVGIILFALTVVQTIFTIKSAPSNNTSNHK